MDRVVRVVLLLVLICSCLNTGASAFHPSTALLKSRNTFDNRLKGGKALSAALPVEALETSSTYISSMLDAVLTTDNIKSAFNVATFLPQPFWLFLIFLPKADITKKFMGGYEVVTLFAFVHFFIVAASIAQPNGTAPMAEFADVFDPVGDPQKAMVGMMQYPNFVSEEWSHVLTWDLFVGRFIWLDGLKRNVFTAHSVLFCNLIGPPGYLLHLITCLISNKGFLTENEAEIVIVDTENVEKY